MEVDKLSVHVRLISDSSVVMDGVAQLLREEFPRIVVDKGVASKKDKIIEKLKLDLSELPIITPDNVTDLAIPIIKKLHQDVSEEEIRQVIEACKTK